MTSFSRSNNENLLEFVRKRTFSDMAEEKPDKVKKKPILIHPRNTGMFENPVRASRGKKGQGSKQQVVIESFVRILDTQDQWDQFLSLRSRMAVIEVSLRFTDVSYPILF